MIRPDVLRAARNVLRVVPGLLPVERDTISGGGVVVAGAGRDILSGAGDVDLVGDDISWAVKISFKVKEQIRSPLR